MRVFAGTKLWTLHIYHELNCHLSLLSRRKNMGQEYKGKSNA